jgi:8-amino-7-oxononanoate synthase
MPPSHLEQRLSALLEKRRAQSKLRNLKSSPPGSVDFSSNDFLSLATNNDFQDDYLALLNNSRTPLGSTGSRLLDGNSELAESLEREIASFHGAEAGLLTNSGFDANVSIFGFLPQQKDVVVYDELIHASVHDGMRQCRTKQQIPFKHNDVEDLSRILQQFSSSGPDQTIFVAVETVYSMEGDLAPLTEIVDLMEALLPHNNAHLIVDEAHATGIYGPNGSGRVCELGLEKRVSIRLHTFGKALASNGGKSQGTRYSSRGVADKVEAIVLCSPVIRLFLINYARPLIYTTFMSYPTLLAIKTAYDWLRLGKANLVSSHCSIYVSLLISVFTARSQFISLNRPPLRPTPVSGRLGLQGRRFKQPNSRHITTYMPGITNIRSSQPEPPFSSITLSVSWLYRPSSRFTYCARRH